MNLKDLKGLKWRLKKTAHASRESFKKYPDREEELFFHIKSLRYLPIPLRQYKFNPTRRYTSDFAWPEQNLLVEVEGWGHKTTKRYLSDIEKYNSAILLGWHILRFTPAQVKSGYAINTLEDYFRHVLVVICAKAPVLLKKLENRQK